MNLIISKARINHTILPLLFLINHAFVVFLQKTANVTLPSFIKFPFNLMPSANRIAIDYDGMVMGLKIMDFLPC